MGFKPRDTSDHEARIADGRSTPVEVPAPQVWRDQASGDTYGMDDDGQLITGYLPLVLGEVARYQIKRDPVRDFFRQAARGAAGILSILNSPAVAAVAALTGVHLHRARTIAAALSQSTPALQARALVDAEGSERMREVLAELDRRLSDGVFSAEDAVAVAAAIKGDTP